MMTTKTVSAAEALLPQYKRSGHGAGSTTYVFASNTDALSWLGKPCYDPQGNIHILYDVDADGNCECPKGFKYRLTDIRCVNYP